MSHSDSEVRDATKERRKKLGTLFKAKFRCRLPTSTELKSEALKRQIGPVLLEFRLLSAVNVNNVEEVKNLLSRGVSPNSADVQKRSALHIAVTRGFKEVVRLLLEYGADPNKRDTIQNTPLHLAACTHNFAIISLLLDAGADLRLLDMHGRHPIELVRSKIQILHRSLVQGNVEMNKMKAELDDVINFMISINKAEGNNGSTSKIVEHLEMARLSLNETNSPCDGKNEDQMSLLLAGLQNFQIG